MSVRLDAVRELDPLAVPLPNGTEVVTRVDRVAGERRVLQGALGRVVGSTEEGLFDVQLVGVGVLRYARDELTPRKVGQTRFAQRRAASWEQLRGTVVLETVVGSRAWGLATETSDTDLRGVFALPFAWRGGLAEPPGVLVSADGSASYWEVARFVRQALRADPNSLEALFVKGARALDPVGAWLLDEREAFVSRELYGSFGRYALSQLDKLSHALRLAEHRAEVLAWLREDPCPSLDAVAARLAARDTRAHRSEADAALLAKQYLKQLYRSLYDQGLLDAADFAAFARFAREGGAAVTEVSRELRPKNAYNLLRLLVTAITWLESGAPEFEVSGAFREELMRIKRGEVPLAEVLRAANELTPRLEEARARTRLPRLPDVPRADALLRRIEAELARRHVLRAPGLWADGALPPPPIEWEGDE